MSSKYKHKLKRMRKPKDQNYLRSVQEADSERIRYERAHQREMMSEFLIDLRERIITRASEAKISDFHRKIVMPDGTWDHILDADSLQKFMEARDGKTPTPMEMFDELDRKGCSMPVIDEYVDPIRRCDSLELRDLPNHDEGVTYLHCSDTAEDYPGCQIKLYEVYMGDCLVGYSSAKFRLFPLQTHPHEHTLSAYQNATSAITKDTASSSPSMVMHQLASICFIKSSVEPCIFEPSSSGYRPDLLLRDGSVAIDFCGESEILKMNHMHHNSRQAVKICINKYKLLGRNVSYYCPGLPALSRYNDKLDMDFIYKRVWMQHGCLKRKGREITPDPLFNPRIAEYLRKPSKYKTLENLTRRELKNRMMNGIRSKPPRLDASAVRDIANATEELKQMLSPKNPYFLPSNRVVWDQTADFDELDKLIFEIDPDEIVTTADSVVTKEEMARSLQPRSLTVENKRKSQSDHDLMGDEDKALVENLYEAVLTPMEYYNHNTGSLPTLRDFFSVFMPSLVSANPMVCRYQMSVLVNKTMKIVRGKIQMKAKTYQHDKITYVPDVDRLSRLPFRERDLSVSGLKIHPMHKKMKLSKLAIVFLASCRDYQEALIKARIAYCSLVCRKNVHYKVKTGIDGLSVSFVRSGARDASDAGVVYVTFSYKNKITKCEKWRNQEIALIRSAPMRMATVVGGMMNTLTDVPQKTKIKLSNIYCRVIAERSWGMSKLYKPFRYLVTGYAFSSPLLKQQFEKFQKEAVLKEEDSDKYYINPVYNKPSLKLLLDMFDPRAISRCPITGSAPKNMGYTAFMMNLCPSEIYGKRRHAVNTSLELFEEIDLAEEFDPYVKDIHKHFEDSFVNSNPTPASVKEHLDKMDRLAELSGGRFTFSPISLVLISRYLRKLASKTDVVGACPSVIDLGTTKASFSSTEMKNSTAMESILEALRCTGESSVFGAVCHLLTQREYVDLTFRLFPKDQVGGDREISIMESNFRLLQSIVESISKKLGSSSGIDYLSNPDKINDMCKSYNRVTKLPQRWLLTADQTRWGPNFNTVLFSYMFCIILGYSTEYYLPALICAMSELKVFQALPYPELMEHMREAYTLPGRTGRYHMGQGIFHYTSSLYHSMVSLLMGDLLKEMVEAENKKNTLYFKPMVTSDDLAVFMGIEPNPEEGGGKLQPSRLFKRLPSLFNQITRYFYRYLCIKSSEYKNNLSSNTIEFNSIFLMEGGVGSNSLKFLNSLVSMKTKGDAVLDYIGVINSYANAMNSGLTSDESLMVVRANWSIFCSQWRQRACLIPFPSMSRLKDGCDPGIVVDDTRTVSHYPVLTNKSYERLSSVCAHFESLSTGILSQCLWRRKGEMIENASMMSDPLSCTFLSSGMLDEYKIYDQSNLRHVSIPAACSMLNRYGNLSICEKPLLRDKDERTPGQTMLEAIQILKSGEAKVRIMAPAPFNREISLQEGFRYVTHRKVDRRGVSTVDYVLGYLGSPEKVNYLSSDQEIMLHIMRGHRRVDNVALPEDLQDEDFINLYCKIDSYLQQVGYTKGEIKRLEYLSNAVDLEQVVCPLVNLGLKYTPSISVTTLPSSSNIESEIHFVNYEDPITGDVRSYKTNIEAGSSSTVTQTISVSDTQIEDELRALIDEDDSEYYAVMTMYSIEDPRTFIEEDQSSCSSDGVSSSEYDDLIRQILLRMEDMDEIDSDDDLSAFNHLDDAIGRGAIEAEEINPIPTDPDDPLGDLGDDFLSSLASSKKLYKVHLAFKTDSRVITRFPDTSAKAIQRAALAEMSAKGCTVRAREGVRYTCAPGDLVGTKVKDLGMGGQPTLVTDQEVFLSNFNVSRAVSDLVKAFQVRSYTTNIAGMDFIDLLKSSDKSLGANCKFLFHLPSIYNIAREEDLHLITGSKDMVVKLGSEQLEKISFDHGPSNKLLVVFNGKITGSDASAWRSEEMEEEDNRVWTVEEDEDEDSDDIFGLTSWHPGPF